MTTPTAEPTSRTAPPRTAAMALQAGTTFSAIRRDADVCTLVSSSSLSSTSWMVEGGAEYCLIGVCTEVPWLPHSLDESSFETAWGAAGAEATGALWGHSRGASFLDSAWGAMGANAFLPEHSSGASCLESACGAARAKTTGTLSGHSLGAAFSETAWSAPGAEAAGAVSGRRSSWPFWVSTLTQPIAPELERRTLTRRPSGGSKTTAFAPAPTSVISGLARSTPSRTITSEVVSTLWPGTNDSRLTLKRKPPWALALLTQPMVPER
mmetsp:Transcript_74493/g.216003  ORF Transcript_74493/g.216003 Transcript_74493/m.216003 type:complete len:267 (+) Transcript_74493:620-1420(+)